MDHKKIVSAKETLDNLYMMKRELDAELASMNARVRSSGRRGLPHDEYKRLCTKQTETKKRILSVERLALKVKAELRKASLPDSLGSGLQADPSLVDSIKRIRDRYLAFSQDATRVSSMRIMASQFAEELGGALGKEERIAGS